MCISENLPSVLIFFCKFARKYDKGIAMSYSTQKEGMPVWDTEENQRRRIFKKYRNYEL